MTDTTHKPFILWKCRGFRREVINTFGSYDDALCETIGIHNAHGHIIVGLHSDPDREEAELFVIDSDRDHAEYHIRRRESAK